MFKRIYVQNSGTAFEDDGVNLNNYTSITDQSVQVIDADAEPEATIDVSADYNGSSNFVTDYDHIRLVFRDGEDVDVSPVIDVSSLEVSDLTYAAPQQQEVEVEVPSGPVGGGTWGIKVTALESGAQPYPRRTYEVEVDDSEAAGDIATKFADAINNAPTSQINDYNEPSVEASASGAVVTITATEVGDIFDVAVQDFTPVDISTTTNPTDGVGTPEQVAEYEHRDDGTLGRYVESTNILGSLPGPATYASDSGEYDLLTFTFDGDAEKAVNKSMERQTYIVALEQSGPGRAANDATDADGNSAADFRDWLEPAMITSKNDA
jgi:hypothetical protein